MLPRQTRVLMAAAEMPRWERVLLQLGFALAMAVIFAWTLLVVLVCWPFAAAWLLIRGKDSGTCPSRGSSTVRGSESDAEPGAAADGGA